MSVVLSSITGQTRESTVALGDAKVTFNYKPYAITLGMSMKLAEGEEEMIDILAQVLEDWDVVETEGKPFPPTAANLKKVPTELATLIATAIVGGEKEVGEADGSFGAG